MISSDPVNILMVDDQPQKLLSYEAILAPLQQKLISVCSAREALAVLLEQKIAVLLVDVIMPEMHGYELASIVREHPRCRNIPMIFVTATSASDVEMIKAYELGAVDYVCVPIVPEILRGKVAAFVDLFRKTRELEALNQDLERRVAQRTADLERTLSAMEHHAIRIEKEVRERRLTESALRAAERALTESHRRKDEFLATLAHELRNPLAPLANALELLKFPQVAEDDAKECMAIMTRQIDQIRRLVDDLLDVARITCNRLVVQPEPIPLQRLFQRAVEACQSQFEGAGQSLLVDLPEESIWIHGDIVRLTQVLANLLNNASKYTPAGGRIWLDWAREKDSVAIRVRDSGIGMPPEVVPRVFEMFMQADSSLTRKRGGLGIGLTLVKQAVELHGGTVTGASDGPDRGSTFTVTLPMCPQGTSDEESRDCTPLSKLPRYRVLVVDDAPISGQLVSRLLGKLGQDVQVVDNGQAALDVLTIFRPDLVISDIAMPQMDGYELARRIRNEYAGETFLVAMTGYGQDEDRIRAQEAGFDRHLVKPAAMATLRELIQLVSRQPHAITDHRTSDLGSL